MQYSALTILLVDEDPSGVQNLQRMLSPVSDMQFKLAHVRELKKGLLWLRKAPIDVVLLDLPAGDDRRLQSIREMSDVAPKVPVIVLAAFVAFDADMRILQSGAQDVIVKAELTAAALIRSIRYSLARTSDPRSVPAQAVGTGTAEVDIPQAEPKPAEVSVAAAANTLPAPAAVADLSSAGEEVDASPASDTVDLDSTPPTPTPGVPGG